MRVAKIRANRVVVLCWSVIAGLWASTTLGQVQIPASLVGSYDVTMQSATTQSPIQNGVSVLLEISQDGVLCVDGIHFTSPFASNGGATISWASSILGLQFTTVSASSFSLNVGSDEGVAYGVLAGNRLSSTTAACGNSAFSASVEDFFRFAEAGYTDLFPTSPFIYTQSGPTSSYRYYPVTNTYLSVSSGGIVQASGGKFGSTPRSIGALDDIWESPDEYDFRDYLTDAEPDTTLGSYYVGTYTLTLTETQPFSPIPDGTTLTFVVTNSLQLCVGELVLSPTLEQPPSIGQTDDELNSRDIPLVWKNPMVGDYYRMVMIEDDEKFLRRGEGNFEFVSSNGFSYGRFSGERTSLSADCGEYTLQPDVSEADLLFDMFEQNYPDIFPGGPQTYTQQVNGSLVREYPQSDVTLRIIDEVVYARGGVFGDAEVRLGKLAILMSVMQGQSIAYAVPATLEGTYVVDFTPTGDHVGIPAKTGLTLALFQDGRLCMDGVTLMQPRLDPLNAAIVRWESSEGGFALQMDTEALVDPLLEMAMVSSSGLGLGTVSGAKSSNLPSCDGQLSPDLSLYDIDLMFGLAELVLPMDFPPSALTYSRIEDSKVLRYYPSTRTLVTVDASGVVVSGGDYGEPGVNVGSVDKIIEMLLGSIEDADAFLNASVTVTGTVEMSLAGRPALIRDIEISEVNVPWPEGLSAEELIPHIQQVLRNELSGSSKFTVNNITTSTSAITFDVVISNKVKMALSSADRHYVLRFSYVLGSSPEPE